MLFTYSGGRSGSRVNRSVREEQLLDRDARLHPGERRTDAVVDAPPEAEMVAGIGAVEAQLVGSVEVGGVAVGRRPEQEQRVALVQVDAAELGRAAHRGSGP